MNGRRPLSAAKGFGGHFRGRIVAGLLLIIPLGLTYLVLRFLWDALAGLLQPLFDVADNQEASPVGGFWLDAIVVVAILGILYIVGRLAPTVLGRQAVGLWNGAVERIPLVRSVYRVARLFTETFTGSTHLGANRVVLLEYPRQGTLGMGMVTGRWVTPEGEEFLAVYIPTVPNPTSGYLAIVKEEQVIDTNMTFDEAMRIVVSGGLLAEEITRAMSARHH